MGSVFNLLSLWFLCPAEMKNAGDARKAGVQEEMCKMKGKKKINKCQAKIAAVWEVDLLSSLSVSQITTYPVLLPFPLLPPRAQMDAKIVL